MKTLIRITLLAFACFANLRAQEYSKNGAFKTKDGFLIYQNDGNESYTLNLKGDVNITYFPIFSWPNKSFHLTKNSKKEFGTNESAIFTNYLTREHEYLENEVIKKKILVTHRQISYKSTNLNFWYFPMPKFDDFKNAGITKPVLKTYHLDFVHSQTIYGLSFGSISGNDADAEKTLLGLFESMRFYDNGIDLDKLKEQIKNGKEL